VDHRIFALLEARNPFRPYALQVHGHRDIPVSSPEQLVVIRPGLIRVVVGGGVWELNPSSVIGIRFEMEISRGEE
jgi:hypothetical protein